MSGSESELTIPTSAAVAANPGQRAGGLLDALDAHDLARTIRGQARPVVGRVLRFVEHQRRLAVIGGGRG